MTRCLLNTSVLTTYGDYRFEGPLTLAAAWQFAMQQVHSAVGHAGTARFLHSRADKNQPELAALLAALKCGQWGGETQTAVAAHVKSEMQQARKWKEKSGKKTRGKTTTIKTRWR